jgi:hypothetical protein
MYTILFNGILYRTMLAYNGVSSERCEEVTRLVAKNCSETGYDINFFIKNRHNTTINKIRL